MIVTRYTQLVQLYRELGPGDVFIGQIPRSHLKPVMLADLASRGVRLLPSATAQLLSASKAAQAFVLQQWMLPHTRVIGRRRELLEALAHYRRHGIETAVTKQDQLHCGHGVRKWNDLDALDSCLSLDARHYPFVLQPFCPAAADVRVVAVGDYWEAYARFNPDGFRMNLSAGGSSRAHALGPGQKDLCRAIMARGDMPFAHMDFLLTGKGEYFLSEISLTGGTHGAAIAQAELAGMKQAHLLAMAQQGAAAAAGADARPRH